MELGNQIKALRRARGITQETLAEKLGVSPQAVSKWERSAAMPDVQLLPELSACFGVTIDELFALSDETRMTRIRNMLWDQRELSAADMEGAERFLLDRARRERGDHRPLQLLAELHNHKAEEHRRLAETYAKTALERNADCRDAFSALVEAMGGRCPDWCFSNHYRLTRWLEEFLAEHPDNVRAMLWLLDQLLDDQRFAEAETWCCRLAQADRSFRAPMYRGMICWYRGDRDGAAEIWAQMQRDFPDDWLVCFSMGDMMARASRFDEAVAYYRQGMAVQPRPRYTDGLTSIAQICEITGDIPGAIAARQEEIAVLAEDWATTTGETVDLHRREIQRLEKLLR